MLPYVQPTVLEGRGTVRCRVQAPALEVGSDIAKRIRKDGARRSTRDINGLGVSTGCPPVSCFERKRQVVLQEVVG